MSSTDEGPAVPVPHDRPLRPPTSPRPGREPGAGGGPGPRRIDNHDLTSDDVPPPIRDDEDEAGMDAANRFAHTFNGYAQGGGPTRLVPLVTEMRNHWEDTGEAPASLTELRSALFLWHRADRHQGGALGARGREREWLNALLDGIRAVLDERSR